MLGTPVPVSGTVKFPVDPHDMSSKPGILNVGQIKLSQEPLWKINVEIN